MAASSVTGVGLGDSNGKYKPELHCGGCACGGKPATEPLPPVKSVCCTKKVYNCRNNVLRSGCYHSSIKTC